MTLQNRVDAAIDAALGDRIVGCVVLVQRAGQPAYSRAAGFADREAGRAMTRNAIFRLASITKPIVAAAALRMVDLGLIDLSDPVTKYIPFFRPKSPDGSESDILIRHLLSHTSGLTYGGDGVHSRGLAGPLWGFEENLRLLSDQTLVFAPGSGWEYGMSIDVLGGVIAAVNGSDLAGVVARYVTGPLNMTDTLFSVRDPDRLAVPYMDGTPPIRMADFQEVVGRDGSVTPFWAGRIFEPRAPLSGGAGMAGTADDILLLLEALRSDFLSSATHASAFSNQIGTLSRSIGNNGKRFGFLGALVTDPIAAGTAMPVGALDWGGAWGHNWVIDRMSETTIVVCTNTTFEGCNGKFREDIVQAVFY